MVNSSNAGPDDAFWAIAAGAPDLLMSDALEERLGEAARDRTVITAELLRRRGEVESLQDDVFQKMVNRVVERHRLPPGSANFVLQRVVDDCAGLSDSEVEEKLRVLPPDTEDVE